MHHVLSSNIDKAFKEAVEQLNLTIAEQPVYGWHKKSIGCHVIESDGTDSWLRLQSRPMNQPPNKLWLGMQDAEHIPISNKPHLRSSVEWDADDRLWRAELMSYVHSIVCSPTPELRHSIAVEQSWYRTLRTSLNVLSQYKTWRVNARQDLITRRLNERFGSQVDPKVDVWTTAHGDIHWANLTHPDCWVLDWEAWGQGPLGLDAANLYCFSLLQPDIVSDVYECFKDLLETSDGIRSQLFICAEQLRMTDLYGDHPELYTHLESLAKGLLSIAPR